MERLQKDQQFLKEAQATLEAETQEMVKVSDRLHDNLVKAMRLMWRQLLFIWGVVILLFIAYFFILSKPSPVPNVPAPELSALEKSGQTSEVIATPQTPPTQPSVKSTQIPEWGAILGIIEQIRAAQLKKDINLFLNTYSPTFPNIDQKKENILKTWQQYDYVDMKFHIDNMEKLNEHTIIAKVAWDITLEDVRSKKKNTLMRDYTIYFSDVSGKWLIQELVQGDKTSEIATRITGRHIHTNASLATNFDESSAKNPRR